jgi:methionyl aminopeptidase
MGKIIIKTQEEIEVIRQNGMILANAIALVAENLKPGVTGLYLDKLAEQFIRDNGATPSFKGYHKFPASLCISINEDVVHGIPHAVALKPGDLISIDAGVFKNNFHADSAYTFALVGASEAVQHLMKVTKESLYKGIEQAIAGNRIGDIGEAVQNYCERKNPYKCVRELVGHGLGKSLHEDPQVPNYGKAGKGDVLPENCVIAIEPMVNLGRKDVYTKNDNWTIATQDHKPSAHFEHTLCVRKSSADILTTFEPIEAALKNNSELIFV